MHSPTTTPEKQIIPIIKYKNETDKTERKQIIKINKYSLVYIVKCALTFFI